MNTTMKYPKQLTLLLLPLALLACNDDDGLNSGTATVEFQSAEIAIKELTSSLYLPVVVKGDHNGLIQIRTEMSENCSGFENDKDILITDYQLQFPVGTELASLEALLSIANEEISPNRSFSITITDVEGAVVGTNATCKINILENSPLEGRYRMEGRSQLQSPAGVTGYACTLTSVDDSFEQLLLDFGQGGAALVEVEATGNEGEYRLTIAANQVIGSYNGNNVALGHKVVSNGRWIDTSDPITGLFRNKVVTFEMDHALGLKVPAVDGWLGLVGSYTDASGNPIPLKFIKQ